MIQNHLKKKLNYANLYNNPLLTALPAELFATNTELTTIYLHGNSLLTALPLKLFATNTELTKIDLSNNPSLTIISRLAFQNNINLETLHLYNTPVRLASIQCPELYYRTRVDLVFGKSYYACDICERPPNTLPTLTFSCWKGNRTSDFTTHHPPYICPRGSWCDPTTYSETLCPHGMFSLVFRFTS